MEKDISDHLLFGASLFTRVQRSGIFENKRKISIDEMLTCIPNQTRRYSIWHETRQFTCARILHWVVAISDSSYRAAPVGSEVNLTTVVRSQHNKIG